MHSSLQSSTQAAGTGTGTSSAAVTSKLSHYQKISTSSAKRTFVRGSSKKNGLENPHLMASNQMGHKIHVSALDDKVKKSSSQSLIKMQAA